MQVLVSSRPGHLPEATGIFTIEKMPAPLISIILSLVKKFKLLLPLQSNIISLAVNTRIVSYPAKNS